MAKKPDVPCAECGTLLWRGGRGDLPAGQKVCRGCRRKSCAEPDCEKWAVARDLCRTHYGQAVMRRRFGNPGCSVENCTRGAAANGLCGVHNVARRRKAGYREPPRPAPRLDNGDVRRRGLAYGLTAEQLGRVDRKAIFERDRWRCGICHRKVHKHLIWPDPGSAVLDHVVPLSVPGTPGHVPSNVQLAHHRCNAVKSNRLGAGVQPALF